MKKFIAMNITIFFVVFGWMGCGSPEDSEGPTNEGPTQGSLQGEVLTEEDESIEGARVIFDGRVEYTDGDGVFSFSDVDPGSYIVEVEQDDFEAREDEVEIHAGEVTEISVIMTPLSPCEAQEVIVEYEGEEICAAPCSHQEDCDDGEYCWTREGVCWPERGFELWAEYPPPTCDAAPRPGRCDVDPVEFKYGPASMLSELVLAEADQCCSDLTDDGESDNALAEYFDALDILGLYELRARFNDGMDSAISAGEFDLIFEYEGLYELAEDGEFWISLLHGADIDDGDVEVDLASFDDGAHPLSLFSEARIEEVGGELVLYAEKGRLLMPEVFSKYLVFGVDVGEPTLLEQVRLEARVVGSSAMVEDGVILQQGELSGVIGFQEIIEHLNTTAKSPSCACLDGGSGGAFEADGVGGYSCILDYDDNCDIQDYLNAQGDFSCHTLGELCEVFASFDSAADVDTTGDGEPDAFSFGMTFEAEAVKVVGVDQ